MRGVAALCVMAFHFTQYQGVNLFYNAPFAVDFFFMLSGFVIAHSYGSRLFTSMGAGEYFAKRLIRLYPLFALGIALGAPVLVAMASQGLAGFTARSLGICTAAHSVFLPCFEPFGIRNMGAPGSEWGEIFPTNPPAWSLFFEMVAGLTFPLFCRASTRFLLALVAVCWACFLGSGFWLGSSQGHYSFFLDAGWGTGNFLVGFPRALFGFGCGVLLYRLRFLAKGLLFKPWMLYLALTLAIAFPFSIKGGYHAAAVTLIAPLIVLAGSQARCEHGLSVRTARFLGRMSYPVYCLHFPVGRSVFMLADKAQLPPFATLALSSACTIAVAYIVVSFVDEPVRRWLSQRLSASIAARQVRVADASLRQVIPQAGSQLVEQTAYEDRKEGSRGA